MAIIVFCCVHAKPNSHHLTGATCKLLLVTPDVTSSYWHVGLGQLHIINTAVAV